MFFCSSMIYMTKVGNLLTDKASHVNVCADSIYLLMSTCTKIIIVIITYLYKIKSKEIHTYRNQFGVFAPFMSKINGIMRR